MLRPVERRTSYLGHAGSRWPLRGIATRHPRLDDLRLGRPKAQTPNTSQSLGVLTKTGKVIPQGVLVRIAKVHRCPIDDRKTGYHNDALTN